jgi:hypothetical protein
LGAIFFVSATPPPSCLLLFLFLTHRLVVVVILLEQPISGRSISLATPPDPVLLAAFVAAALAEGLKLKNTTHLNNI